MKANTKELLSNCCQAPLKAWSGDEGTGYYECTRCLRAADQMVPSTPTELPSSFEKKWEEVEKAWKGKPIPTWIKEVSKQLFSLGAQEALQRVEERFDLEMSEDFIKRLENNLQIAFGKGECSVCGTNPRHQKKYLMDVLAKLREEMK